jgi:TolB-like protein/Tfp pilus assembly protein PilF
MEGRLRFDRFTFDTATARLWADDEEIRLTPKAANVLRVLVAHAGETVSKDKLFAAVWPGVVVTDDALTTCIAELRRALNDDPKQPRFIETRHRRGYLFAAPPLPAERAGAAAHDVAAIAVLPFADLSPAADHAYLCDGIAEELINALTQVDGLRVVARAASSCFREIGTDVRAAGRQLGANALLTGSVRKSGGRLRVSVQLIDAGTGYHRWSRQFDRAFDDVFAIQDEIAGSVARSLRGEVLSPAQRQSIRRPVANTSAYEHFLRARQCLARQTREDHKRGVQLFERAIAIDPSYAPAYAGLAMAHAALHEWFGAEEADREAAERNSERALALAPNLADVHVARGCALSLSRRYAEAAEAFEAAIDLNPNLFEAYYYHARSSFAAGQIERSADLFCRAAAARREDFQSALLAAQSLRRLGRAEEAREMGLEGIRRAERALELNPGDSRAMSLAPGTLLEVGEPDRALEWLERGLSLHPDDMSTLINGACVYARLGNKERALDLLERAFTWRWGQRDWIEHDSDYDNLRDEPRFQTLLARLR